VFAQRVKALFPQARHLLLLSNSGVKDDLDALRHALPFLRVGDVDWETMAPWGATSASDWRLAQHRAIIEQILGSMADAFLAGPWHFRKLSSFARVVIEERQLEGRPPNTTFFMQPRGHLVMQVDYMSPLTALLTPGPTQAGGAPGPETVGTPALNCIACVD